MAVERQFQTVKVDDIKSWMYQRTMVDHNQTKVSLAEITESIREKGVIEPIILRLVKDELQGVAGYLRWLCSQKAGLTEIPAIVYSGLDDLEATDILLIENTNRQEMADIDVSNVLQRYVNEGFKNKEIASRIHMSESYVSQYLSLLKDSLPVRQALSERTEGFTEKHARMVRALPERLHKKAVKQVKGKTVREAKEIITDLVGKNRKTMLRAEIDECKAQLKAIDEAEKEKLKVESEIAKMKGQLATLKTDDKRMNALTLQIETLRSKYFPAVEKLSKAKARRTEIRKQLPKYKVEPLKKERDNAYSRIGKLQAEIKELRASLSEKTKAVKEIKAEVKRLEEKISYHTTLTKEERDLNKIIEGLEEQTKKVEKKHATAIKNFKNLKESVDAYQAGLIEKRSEILTKIGELKGTVRSLNGRIANRTLINKRIEHLQAELKS